MKKLSKRIKETWGKECVNRLWGAYVKNGMRGTFEQSLKNNLFI